MIIQSSELNTGFRKKEWMRRRVVEGETHSGTLRLSEVHGPFVKIYSEEGSFFYQ
jgi:hypothetical protein